MLKIPAELIEAHRREHPGCQCLDDPEKALDALTGELGHVLTWVPLAAVFRRFAGVVDTIEARETDPNARRFAYVIEGCAVGLSLYLQRLRRKIHASSAQKTDEVLRAAGVKS